ncbi:MAG: B12-binding domain-containing radical SAM protein [Candidatus Heimdallarchaeota archaeon]|nr:MAG: B12-binding domain-containing radical SAM protein [Candidatus Heimdallarchaeota archaeon]
MHVLLLAMPNTAFYFHHFAVLPNLALCSIAGNIGEEHHLSIADLVLQRRNVRGFLEKRLLCDPPDLVGLSSMSFQSKTARSIARFIKTFNPEIRIALGGYHASMIPEEVGRSWGNDIDFIVKREGEHTFKELLHALENNETDLQHIKGLSYRKNGEFIHNAWRPLTELSSLNLPNRDVRLLTKGFHILGKKADVIETSRGCKYECKFCSINKMYGRSFRAYKIERILTDIENCKKQGTKAIFFADDNISLNSRHFRNLCEGIIKRGLTDIHYTTQAHVGSLYSKPKLLKLALEANFKAFFLGIENPHQEKLQTIGKNVSNMAKKAEAVVSQIRGHGAIAMGGLIVGNPDDKVEDFYNVLHYTKQIKADAPVFFVLTPYPNTQIREILIQKKLVTNPYDYSNYDALSANIKTSYLTTDAVEILTEYLYDNFKSLDWIFHTNLRRAYPWYFLKLLRRLLPLSLIKIHHKIKRENYNSFLKKMVMIKKDFRNLKR